MNRHKIGKFFTLITFKSLYISVSYLTLYMCTFRLARYILYVCISVSYVTFCMCTFRLARYILYVYISVSYVTFCMCKYRLATLI